VTAGGGRLPGGGNCPPLESASRGLLVVFLRAGLPPASFSAPAKSRLLAWDAWEPADAGALSCMASLLRCDWETGGVAFIPVKLQATCQCRKPIYVH
jgi:hypothetical protein